MKTRHFCPVCGERVIATNSGKSIRGHRDKAGRHCDGSGEPWHITDTQPRKQASA